MKTENLTNLMPTSMMVVDGPVFREDRSNVRVVNTTVIPNIGDHIFLGGKTYKVNFKNINYSQVEDYELEEEGRGSEMVYVFVTQF